MAETITRDVIEHVALLARLELTPGETEEYLGQLNEILDYMAALAEVEVEGVEPTFHVLEEMRNVWRADEEGDCLPRPEALANAPVEERGCFKVPPVIE